MEDKDKKVVSPFEFAITEIVNPEAAKTMREETITEKREGLEREFRDKISRIKVLTPKSE